MATRALRIGMPLMESFLKEDELTSVLSYSGLIPGDGIGREVIPV
jgi:hypothetical protein